MHRIILSGQRAFRGLAFPDGTPVNDLDRKGVFTKLADIGVDCAVDQGRDVLLTAYASHLQARALDKDSEAFRILNAWDEAQGLRRPWNKGKGLEATV